MKNFLDQESCLCLGSLSFLRAKYFIPRIVIPSIIFVSVIFRTGTYWSVPIYNVSTPVYTGVSERKKRGKKGRGDAGIE